MKRQSSWASQSALTRQRQQEQRDDDNKSPNQIFPNFLQPLCTQSVIKVSHSFLFFSFSRAQKFWQEASHTHCWVSLELARRSKQKKNHWQYELIRVFNYTSGLSRMEGRHSSLVLVREEDRGCSGLDMTHGVSRGAVWGGDVSPALQTNGTWSRPPE